MQVDGVLARREAAGEADLVVEAGGVGPGAQVVAQKIENRPALVGIADRDVPRRLDPQVDVGVDGVRPAGLDHHVAGWLRGLVGGGLGLLLADVRQEQHGHGDEATQGEHDQVAKDDVTIVAAILVKRLHRALQSR